jgi:hypothetical protein
VVNASEVKGAAFGIAAASAAAEHTIDGPLRGYDSEDSDLEDVPLPAPVAPPAAADSSLSTPSAAAAAPASDADQHPRPAAPRRIRVSLRETVEEQVATAWGTAALTRAQASRSRIEAIRATGRGADVAIQG